MESFYRDKAGHEWSCRWCGKSFSSGSSLQRHQLIHTGEKPYKCHVCSKSFTQKGILTRHLLTHSGEKTFVCKYCDRPYALKGNLTSHLKSHTREQLRQSGMESREITRYMETGSYKPFSCYVCGKSFSAKANVANHVRIHMKPKDKWYTEALAKVIGKEIGLETTSDIVEKPFSCEICGERFFHQHNLIRHQREHPARDEITCHMCKQEFTNEDQFKQHFCTTYKEDHNANFEIMNNHQAIDSTISNHFKRKVIKDVEESEIVDVNLSPDGKYDTSDSEMSDIDTVIEETSEITSEDNATRVVPEQTARMRRLVWDYTGCKHSSVEDDVTDQSAKMKKQSEDKSINIDYNFTPIVEKCDSILQCDTKTNIDSIHSIGNTHIDSIIGSNLKSRLKNNKLVIQRVRKCNTKPSADIKPSAHWEKNQGVSSNVNLPENPLKTLKIKLNVANNPTEVDSPSNTVLRMEQAITKKRNVEDNNNCSAEMEMKVAKVVLKKISHAEDDSSCIDDYSTKTALGIKSDIGKLKIVENNPAEMKVNTENIFTDKLKIKIKCSTEPDLQRKSTLRVKSAVSKVEDDSEVVEKKSTVLGKRLANREKPCTRHKIISSSECATQNQIYTHDTRSRRRKTEEKCVDLGVEENVQHRFRKCRKKKQNKDSEDNETTTSNGMTEKPDKNDWAKGDTNVAFNKRAIVIDRQSEKHIRRRNALKAVLNEKNGRWHRKLNNSGENAEKPTSSEEKVEKIMNIDREVEKKIGKLHLKLNNDGDNAEKSTSSEEKVEKIMNIDREVEKKIGKLHLKLNNDGDNAEKPPSSEEKVDKIMNIDREVEKKIGKLHLKLNNDGDNAEKLASSEEKVDKIMNIDREVEKKIGKLHLKLNNDGDNAEKPTSSEEKVEKIMNIDREVEKKIGKLHLKLNNDGDNAEKPTSSEEKVDKIMNNDREVEKKIGKLHLKLNNDGDNAEKLTSSEEKVEKIMKDGDKAENPTSYDEHVDKVMKNDKELEKKNVRMHQKHTNDGENAEEQIDKIDREANDHNQNQVYTKIINIDVEVGKKIGRWNRKLNNDGENAEEQVDEIDREANDLNENQVNTSTDVNSCDKPFVCDVCRKMFKFKCALNLHMGSHTGKKPYKCSKCRQSFQLRMARKMHMVTHK